MVTVLSGTGESLEGVGIPGPANGVVANAPESTPVSLSLAARSPSRTEREQDD